MDSINLAIADSLQFFLPYVWFLAFWIVIMGLGTSKRLQERGFKVRPFYLMYRTEKANQLFESLSRHSRFWVGFARIGVGLGFLLSVSAMGFLLLNLSNFFFSSKDFSAVTLLIPGVTIQSTPALLYFFLSIPFILLVHEGAHGVIARLEKIRVKSAGLLFVAVLIGGFVEPDENEFKQAKAMSRMKVVAAGSTANILFSLIIAALLLTTPFFATILPAPARPVFYGSEAGIFISAVQPGSPAESAGLFPDDVIVIANGRKVNSIEDYRALAVKPGQLVQLEVRRGDSIVKLEATAAVSPVDSNSGIIGFGGPTYFPPRLALPSIYIPSSVVLFFFWLWFLSFNIGVFNMLPFFPLDGDGLVNAALSSRLKDRYRKVVRIGFNVLALSLIGGNLLISFIFSGLTSI